MMRMHDEESARRICGAMQQEFEGGKKSAAAAATQIQTQKQKAYAFEDNNKLFLKVFLIDGSVNLNSWGVDPRSIRRNINSAIGKPVVMYKNSSGEFDHPPLSGQEDLDHAYAYQDLFRIGTFIDVFESNRKPGEWWGVAEVTDDGVKQAIKEDPSIPFYVSPTIRLLNPLQDEHKLTEWSFMHSAVVDRPAFGTAKALISGHCNGDSNTCLLQLRKASISANNGKVGCGFCTYKAAKEIQRNISSLLNTGNNNKNRHNIMNSNDQNDNSQPENNQNAPQQQQQQQPTDQQQQQQQQQPVVEEQQNVQTTTTNEQKKQVKRSDNAEERGDNAGQRGDNRNADNPGRSASAQELLEAIQRLSTQKKELELQLQTAKADNQTLHSVNAQFNDRLARLEQEREEERRVSRASEITNFVSNAPAYKLLTPQERAAQIESFVQGSMTLEDIKRIVEPLNASVQKASLGGFPNRSASYTPRLSLGGRTGNTIETRSASEQSTSDGEEVPYYLRLADSMFKGKSEV